MIRTLKVAGLLSAGGLALLLAGTGTQAEPPGITDKEPIVQATSLAGVPFRVVRIADLNLEHPAGLEALQSRIRFAVNSVCGEFVLSDVRGARAVRDCREASYEDAMAQVEGQVTSVKVAAR